MLRKWAPHCEVPFFMRIALAFILIFVHATSLAQSFQEMKGTLVVGHRCGFYSSFPENSIEMAQFVLSSVPETPVVFEFDVRRSKDSTMFVMHDETVDRTTNGIGYIHQISDNILNSLKLKSLDGKLTQNPVLTLNAWLDLLQSENCLFMFDIKDCNLNELLVLIKEKNLEARSLLLFFSPEKLLEFEKKNSRVSFSYLVEDASSWALLKNTNRPSNFKFAYVTKSTPISLISGMKQSGVRIMSDLSENKRNNGNLYPQSEYQSLVKDRWLDVVITDFPIEVIQILSR